MGKVNKSYRIRANVNRDSVLNFDMTQTFDKFDILSLTLDQKSAYRLTESDTGVIAGRVLANGGFGVPNAKVSVFIEYEDTDDIKSRILYNYTSTQDLDSDGIRYNLLSKIDEACHQNVGTFPAKRVVLDNNDWIEIFDKYYTYTTRTNNAGDYMIYGVPVGMQTVHMDVDLSDIGVLSQTPRDMMYKGYNADLFDSPTKFKKDTNLASLVQIISQDTEVYVYPFWGDTTNTTTNAAITRCDINISYKFEPTCIFMGSVISDTGDKALSKKCVGAKEMGKMSELMTGEGKIEMIRKTYDNKVESFSIKGDKVINENGVWCYQIPMNLDYVVTDEYGNTVLSDNPDLGIPTRTKVRFRVSMSESDSDETARKRARYLVPNNPRLSEEDCPEFYKTKEVDYEFGSKTKDEDFRDLMWNNVYTVKNYIPRLQKNRRANSLKHVGIKMVNHSGGNNPMPYNNLRIKFNFTYMFLCVLSKVLITIVRLINGLITGISAGFYNIAKLCVRIANADLPKIIWGLLKWFASVNGETPDQSGVENLNDKYYDDYDENTVVYMLNKLCTTMVDSDGNPDKWNFKVENCNIGGLAAFFMVLVYSIGCGIRLNGMCETDDGEEINVTPGTNDTIKNAFNKAGCMACNDNVSELYNCIENQLAQDNEVTSFNFYNDWVNGVLYMPLWYRRVKPKRKFLGISIKAKDQYCSTDLSKYKGNQKTLLYSTMVPKRSITSPSSSNPMGTINPLPDDSPYVTGIADDESGLETIYVVPVEADCYGYECHSTVHTYQIIKSGYINEKETMLGDYVQYYRPTYFDGSMNKDLVTLFATDIVLLGSLNSCDLHGIPQFFKALESTTYNMPPDLMSEDYEYKSDSSSTDETSDDNEIDLNTRYTEYTGADWGNLGVDQSNVEHVLYTGPTGRKYTLNANENMYDNGGLFYGITCFDSYTKPKSVINLERICEFGVSLDESQEILSTSSLTRSSSEDDVVNAYETLTPDGFVSYDEIYNPDYRSMFATLNANFLKTKKNYDTGLTEYDLTHMYVDNFDGSMSKLMKAKTVNGMTEKSEYTEKANYIGNYNLEKSSDAYLNFRFGNYVKGNGNKIYYYDYRMSTSFYIASDNRIPRYENSFYFYFGLNEGKTAIDVFNTDYFSDCSQEETTEGVYDMSYVGNSWCPSDSEDGYIAFSTNMETPIKVVFTEVNNPEQTYTVEGITVNKFYIGTRPTGELDGYTQYSLYDDFHGIDNVLIIPNGKYKVTITDGDGINYNDNLEFGAEYLTYDIDSKSFSVKNSDLDEKFEAYTAEGALDWSQIFPAIANFGGAISLGVIRDIHGYIEVGNISVDNFILSITPSNQSFFDASDGTHLYSGATVNVKNNVVESHSGDGYLGIYNGKYYFGAPYGEQKYVINVTQCCVDEDGNMISTGNSVSAIVPVREGLLKMYLNGVDYDNIRNFKTGWANKTSANHYERMNDINNGDCTFDANDMYGWNDLDNIGQYWTTDSAGTWVKKNIDKLDYTDNEVYIRQISDILLDTYEGNGVIYYQQTFDGDKRCDNPYTWTSGYCYTTAVYNEDIKLLTSVKQVTYTDSDDNETTVNVYRTDNIVSSDIYSADYISVETGNAVISEDEDGNLTYIDGYSNYTGSTFKDKRDIIDRINDIINSRKDFVNTVKAAFRIGKGETGLSITYRSNETPIRYLIVGNGEKIDTTGGRSSTGSGYTIDTARIFDTDFETNYIPFTLPTLIYNNGGWAPYSKIVGRDSVSKHPYYTCIQDNNKSTLPTKSNTNNATPGRMTIPINNFNTDNPYLSYYYDNKYSSVMFGVHFYNKPMYTYPTNILCAVNSYPVYNSSDKKRVSLNGFIVGYTHNGIADYVLTSIFGNTIKTYTDPTANENDSDVKRVYYSDIQGTFGTYQKESYCTSNYQYIESGPYTGDIMVSDGYGESYSETITTNIAISFDGTTINGSTSSDDYIDLSLSNGGNATYYLYQWNGSNHPFDLLDSDNKYSTMPACFTESLASYTGFITKTSSNKLNITQNAVSGNNKYFIIGTYGVNRIYTPVFDIDMPRVIRSFYQNGTKVENVLYITQKITPNATGADISNLYYLANYNFNINFKVYDANTSSYEVTNTMTVTDNSTVHITVTDGSWTYTAEAIKVTISDDIKLWEHAFITDILGIEKSTSEETECTVVEG